MGLGLIRYCIFPWSDVCVDTEINSVGWQRMDCALSYCLTMAFPSLMLYRVERLCLYFLWENGYCLCYSRVLTKLRSLKCIMHYFFLFMCVFCLLHFFFFNFILCSALENIVIRHILSYRGFLYKAASLYACSSPNNYVTTELFVMVHVCQHFCRALFPITSISICRITNKCVYNSRVWSLVFFPPNKWPAFGVWGFLYFLYTQGQYITWNKCEFINAEL